MDNLENKEKRGCCLEILDSFAHRNVVIPLLSAIIFAIELVFHAKFTEFGEKIKFYFQDKVPITKAIYAILGVNCGLAILCFVFNCITKSKCCKSAFIKISECFKTAFIKSECFKNAFIKIECCKCKNAFIKSECIVAFKDVTVGIHKWFFIPGIIPIIHFIYESIQFRNIILMYNMVCKNYINDVPLKSIKTVIDDCLNKNLTQLIFVNESDQIQECLHLMVNDVTICSYTLMIVITGIGCYYDMSFIQKELKKEKKYYRIKLITKCSGIALIRFSNLFDAYDMHRELADNLYYETQFCFILANFAFQLILFCFNGNKTREIEDVDKKIIIDTGMKCGLSCFKNTFFGTKLWFIFLVFSSNTFSFVIRVVWFKENYKNIGPYYTMILLIKNVLYGLNAFIECIYYPCLVRRVITENYIETKMNDMKWKLLKLEDIEILNSKHIDELESTFVDKIDEIILKTQPTQIGENEAALSLSETGSLEENSTGSDHFNNLAEDSNNSEG